MKWSRKAAVISLSPEIKYLSSQLQELGGGINTRAGELAVYCRISPMRKRFATDYITAVTIDADSHEIVAKHQLLSSGEAKSQRSLSLRFAVETVFDATCENSLIRDTLLTASDKNSAVAWVWAGFNTALITYGEADSGKSFTLFSPAKGAPSAYERAVQELLVLMAEATRPETTNSYSLAVSVWELVHSQTDRCEVVSDLLRVSDAKPLPGGTGDLTTVQVNTVEEAVLLLQAAKELSENWRANAEGSFDCLHNRGHFFVRIMLYEGIEKRVSSLHLIDLAGTLPSNLSPELRAKLGSDEQLTATRLGLNQFRSMIWELSKSDGSKPVDLAAVVSTRKSKLAQFLGPVLAGNCRTYLLGCVKEDSAFADSCKTLELLMQAGKICTPCMKTTGVEKADLKLTHFSILQA